MLLDHNEPFLLQRAWNTKENQYRNGTFGRFIVAVHSDLSQLLFF